MLFHMIQSHTSLGVPFEIQPKKPYDKTYAKLAVLAEFQTVLLRISSVHFIRDGHVRRNLKTFRLIPFVLFAENHKECNRDLCWNEKKIKWTLIESIV